MSSNASISQHPPASRASWRDETSRELSRLRIVVLSDALRERNGAGTYYHDLVDELRGHVERAELFCPTGTSKSSFDYLALPMPGDPTQQLRLPSYRRLSRAVREIDPHVIVSATPGPYGFLGCWLARRWKLPLCAGHHTRFDKLVELYWRGRLGRIAGNALEWINGLLFRSSSMVVATSPEMVEHAQGTGAGNVWLMGTPIGRRFLISPPPPAPDRLNSVLYAGRLASEKNIEAVLEAAEQLDHLRFVIAGDGPLRSLVEEKARRLPNLTFAGWVVREELVSHFDACDLLVLPSHVESFGTVAVEAMARRRPVIVSPHCGILDWEPLSSAVNSMSDEETLADSLRRVGAWQGAELAAAGEAAYEAVRALNARTVDRWLDVLGRLVHAPTAGRAEQPAGYANVSA